MAKCHFLIRYSTQRYPQDPIKIPSCMRFPKKLICEAIEKQGLWNFPLWKASVPWPQLLRENVHQLQQTTALVLSSNIPLIPMHCILTSNNYREFELKRCLACYNNSRNDDLDVLHHSHIIQGTSIEVQEKWWFGHDTTLPFDAAEGRTWISITITMTVSE